MTHEQYLLCDRIISRYDMKTYVSVIDAELSRKAYNEHDIIKEHCSLMMSEVSEALGVRISRKTKTMLNRMLVKKQNSISGDMGVRKASTAAETVKSIGCILLSDLNKTVIRV